MRLFVALSPSPEARRDLADAVQELRSHDEALRWTESNAWHLTLVFLGSVDDSMLPELTQRLGRAARRHPALQLAFAGAGAFGSRRRARVLWAGVTGDREPLRRLAGSVGAAARRAGIAIDEHPYRPHLTLARARIPRDVTREVEALASYDGPPWAAAEILLIRSHLGRETRYEVIGSWALAKPASSQP